MPSLRVLVADDEPVSRTVVGAMLKKAGYEVTFAPDGEQAWQQLTAPNPPAIALLDWEMPGLARLDELGRSGDLSALAPLVASLEAEYGRVESEIQRLIR